MKLKLILIAIATVLFAPAVFAGDGPDSIAEDGEKLNLWIPSLLINIAADIAEDHIEEEEEIAIAFMDKIGNINICIREGKYYSDRTDKKVTRKLDRMERKNYEEMVSIITPDERVNLSIKQNKNGKIKRIVLIVDESGESYVYLKVNCRIKPEDLTKLIEAYS